MNKFNLTFSGEILAGHDPATVKVRFGKMFAIDDPVRLERFFTGQSIILRRNLERKAAAQYYHELHQLGVAAALVKVTASESVDALLKTSPIPPGKSPQHPPRNKADIAAQLQARKAEALRLAAEQGAREQAIREEQQREADEDYAREQLRAAKARRSAEEEAARKAAERAQIKLREVEDAARKQAAKDESQRQSAAAAARVKALREEQKAERARQKAAAAAKRRAELEQIRQREAEESARVQAELAALKRREAEEAARQKAEQAEIEQQEAAEAARLQTELAQIKQQEAQEAARIKAEAQRREEEAQRQSAERRRAAAEQLAAQRAQRKEEKRSAVARQAELNAQQVQAASQLATEAATELAQASPLNPSRVRAATGPEARQPRVPDIAKVALPAPRKRQAGEPNLYKLRPFRNTDEVRARSANARQRRRHGYTLGVMALAALLIAGGYFLRHPLAPAISGAAAITVDEQQAPLLLAGSSLLFHDRAGVSTKEKSLRALAVYAMQAPLAFDSSGALLALGRLESDNGDVAAGQARQLLRCELEASRCERFSPLLQGSSIAAFVIHPLDGSLLLADHAVGELLKITRTGQIVARTSTAIPQHPILRLHGGLLLMNSAEGPGISVFRYENTAFGQQLDEILLLPPHLQAAENIRVEDFLWSSGTWWARLSDPAAGIHGLYRFDEEWNYLDQVAVPHTTSPLQLVNWGEKTLVNDPHHAVVQRFNAIGKAEAPFVSRSLESLVAREGRGAHLTSVAWRGGLLLCTLVALLGFAAGYLQKLRALVYKPVRERGAEPVDEHADSLCWIDPMQHRSVLLRRRSISYLLLVVGIALVAMSQSVTVWQLCALLLALSGPAIALLLLSRYPVGYIGILEDRLLLVDHSGMYHIASGSRVQYHGPFLAIDDVVVFTGSRLLPAFSATQVENQAWPLARGGVKVDRNTVVVKLLQSRHPIAQGACAVLVMAASAVLVLCLRGIF